MFLQIIFRKKKKDLKKEMQDKIDELEAQLKETNDWQMILDGNMQRYQRKSGISHYWTYFHTFSYIFTYFHTYFHSFKIFLHMVPSKSFVLYLRIYTHTSKHTFKSQK